MDRELKMSGLDLKLTPYRVIATSPTTGMVSISSVETHAPCASGARPIDNLPLFYVHVQLERVQGNPLSKVLAEYSRDLKAFFRHHHPDRTGPL